VTAPISRPQLRERVQEVDWFHTIDLGQGILTPGRDDTRQRLERLGLPDDLSGKSVLDVGAWDGFFSFECERRGARRVLATDSFVWERRGRAGFDLARQALGSRVEDMHIDVLELSPERVGRFDLVLFLGVLYHMRHPLLALERAASVTGGRLVLETEVDLALLRRPAAAFYPGLERGEDWTNWWGPNPPAVVAMLRAVGFDRVEVVSPNSLAYRLARMGWRSLRRRPWMSGRLVVHALR
jgi:tRNA (mo5U34)-methyltransferase